ncbi:YhcN/YlaJ family sporulation lipoprotein [Sporanaerobacter acetigenes]|uniref:Sporulation lipoprotein, YhcN/YlaJ family n=1 Tax=Sporanaerobacter acetigenes DSM 13106 TaxID=1123281 RepID=A0A1M5UI36_9FIRM|nr:YhcN/YlaJ family sporulation lipoprotein [Sporanaerobacter acetigenes]SHH62647.1 sporulation lipoprotein, YhcN/YlaJ family [Sporanaerobacter acetigenes DSM 13106]
MKGKKIKVIVSTFLAVFLVFIMCSCQKNEVKVEEEDNEDVSTNVAASKTNEFVEMAENIADNVVDLIGVEDATAIIYGEDIVVAVEMSDKNTLTIGMKGMIKDVVMNNDNMINNVFITDDAKIFEKVDTIEQNLIKGEDIKNYREEINKIKKRISSEKNNE